MEKRAFHFTWQALGPRRNKTSYKALRKRGKSEVVCHVSSGGAAVSKGKVWRALSVRLRLRHPRRSSGRLFCGRSVFTFHWRRVASTDEHGVRGRFSPFLPPPPLMYGWATDCECIQPGDAAHTTPTKHKRVHFLRDNVVSKERKAFCVFATANKHTFLIPVADY
jgi:hypothetical protein